MSRTEFMNQLKNLLWDIPKEEREEALNYYEDYFDDAGADHEAQVIEALGSPEKVAAIIKEGLKEERKDQGEYSETGYTGYGTPAKEEVVSYEQPKKKSFADRIKGLGKGGIILILILAIFALPILGLIGIGIASTIFGLIAAAVAIVFAVAAAGIALLVAGAVVFASAIGCLIVTPAVGMMLLGAALVIIGIGILITVLGIWILTKVVPGLIRFVVDLIRKIFAKKEV